MRCRGRAEPQALARGRRELYRLGRVYRPITRAVTIRLDADVLDWFRSQGAGYQTWVNRVLREYVAQQGGGATQKLTTHEPTARHRVRTRKR